MVSTADYVLGANVLYYSLQKHLDPAVAGDTDFYVLLIEGHGNVANKAIADGLVG